MKVDRNDFLEGLPQPFVGLNILPSKRSFWMSLF